MGKDNVFTTNRILFAFISLIFISSILSGPVNSSFAVSL